MELKQNKSISFIEFYRFQKTEYINIHGPEHHFLDGASFLVAYNNVTKKINIKEALDKLAQRTLKMPGAMCGYWGGCGASTSLGAALSIITQTTPLTDNEFYKSNMELTSSIISEMSVIGGPRCCKRNAFISLIKAIKFVNKRYGLCIPVKEIKCDFSKSNRQCIEYKCPFYKIEK